MRSSLCILLLFSLRIIVPNQKLTDIQVTGVELYFLPVEMRVPLKFGTETMTAVTCARVKVTVASRDGDTAIGWGETPLNVGWVWPSSLSYALRDQTVQAFCQRIAAAWCEDQSVAFGHPMELGQAFLTEQLPRLLSEQNNTAEFAEPMPHLAALVCASPFDIALHDAFGCLVDRPVYETYNAEYMNHDLAYYLEPAGDAAAINFAGQYPQDYFESQPKQSLPVWHLVGGIDPLTADELTGNEPLDDHPVLLVDWIKRDGLKCLKIKLRGNDADWDYQRLVDVGNLAIEHGVTHLTADFNCTVREPLYVVQVLDRLQANAPLIYERLLYVEQPFPYDLEANQIDVREVSNRVPLLMDESAHDWQIVRLGRRLGWNGVALKTCKTQTGALLSLCWAKAHGMHLMVQDLTNPMLAQIPHVQLAAHISTMHGVESNGMQFYPAASDPEARVHPGLYRRREGVLDLSTLIGPGFGYRVDEIERQLPEPVASFQN